MSAASDAKSNYMQFAHAVRNSIMQTYVQAKAGKGTLKLASTTDDQVFIPIVPCRIVDSRNAQGPIAAGTARLYFFFSASPGWSWSNGSPPQGGTPGLANSACPGTTLNGAGGTLGNAPPSAAVATVTVVDATAAGNFVVWGGNVPAPTTSVLNFTAGQVLANTTVIPYGGRGSVEDFAIAYNGPTGSANVVVDVIGYFVENHGTPLDCLELFSGFVPVGAGAQVTVNAPACTAGYTLTGGECTTDNGNVSLAAAWNPAGTLQGGNWQCTSKNFDLGAAHTVYGYSICCRIPGQ